MIKKSWMKVQSKSYELGFYLVYENVESFAFLTRTTLAVTVYMSIFMKTNSNIFIAYSIIQSLKNAFQ